jgi:hypothetical protein
MKAICRLLFLTIAVLIGISSSTASLAACTVTSDGKGDVNRVTKFTAPCNVENSAIAESKGKVGIGITSPTSTLDVNGGAVIRGAASVGNPPLGGSEFQVWAPNQSGLWVSGPVNGVGAGLDLSAFSFLGSNGWELLATGSAASQGPQKFNIQDTSTAIDALTIDQYGDVGIGTTIPEDASSRLVVQGGNASSIVAVNGSGFDTLDAYQNGTGYVAFFRGTGGFCFIDTNGNLTCTGRITGGAAWHGRGSSSRPGQIVKTSATNDAENRVEDFGSASLKNGAATVALGSAFAQAITGNRYQVFVTPDDDCRGLYVARKTAQSFEVRELGCGRSGVEFDYRIVAHRTRNEEIPASANNELAGAAVNRHPTQQKAPGANLVMEDGAM